MSALGSIVAALLPSPLGALRTRLEPNPAAPSLPIQSAIAAGQNVRRGIRGGLSGMSGSEADYADGQRTPDVLIQDLSAYAIEPSRLRSPNANLPPSMYAYNPEPVIIRRPRWGGSTRNRPKVVSATLLPPTSRTPGFYEMARSRQATQPNEGRLTDPFEEE